MGQVGLFCPPGASGRAPLPSSSHFRVFRPSGVWTGTRVAVGTISEPSGMSWSLASELAQKEKELAPRRVHSGTGGSPCEDGWGLASWGGGGIKRLMLQYT